MYNSNKLLSLLCDIVLRKNVFSRRNEENDLSAVAEVTGNVK